jgi:hypothetical protein
MSRTINLNLSSEDIVHFAETIGLDKLWGAIGYLSTWNLDYHKVAINRDGRSEDLVAVYWKPDNTVGYVIGAVWHGDHYGFHS